MAVDVTLSRTDFSEGDIARMTRRELDAAKVVLGLAITEIQTELAERENEPTTDDLDAPEWHEYRRWRSRANAALKHRRRQLAAVKLRLQGAVLDATAASGPRTASLRAELADGSADVLLLGAYRVIRRLLEPHRGESLPERLDERDGRTIALISRYLRDRYRRSELTAALR